jgi:malate synthase
MENNIKSAVFDAATSEYKIVEETIIVNLDELAHDVRENRNRLLKESDWTQVLDAPVNKEAWALYRQELRDITEQETFPLNVVFPIKP